VLAKNFTTGLSAGAAGGCASAADSVAALVVAAFVAALARPRALGSFSCAAAGAATDARNMAPSANAPAREPTDRQIVTAQTSVSPRPCRLAPLVQAVNSGTRNFCGSNCLKQRLIAASTPAAAPCAPKVPGQMLVRFPTLRRGRSLWPAILTIPTTHRPPDGSFTSSTSP